MTDARKPKKQTYLAAVFEKKDKSRTVEVCYVPRRLKFFEKNIVNPEWTRIGPWVEVLYGEEGSSVP